MNFFPFLTRRYVTRLDADTVRRRLESAVAPPPRSFSLLTAGSRTVTGMMRGERFVWVAPAYGLTYGKTSLLPHLVGRYRSLADGGTELRIRIQPSRGGALWILLLAYGVAALGIGQLLRQQQPGGVLVCSAFILVTYLSVLIRFNADKKRLLRLLESAIQVTTT